METKQYDALTVKIFPTRDQMGQQAAQEAVVAMQAMLETQEELNVMFGAAPSQNEVLAALVASDLDWSRVNAFHMDEYVSLPVGDERLFSVFLDRAIFEKVPFKQVFRIDPQGTPEDVCPRYAQLLSTYPLDVVFMGIGENGHIAFNDPPYGKFDDAVLVKPVELEQRCRQQQVNDGCFATIDDVPTVALTVTIPAMLSAKYICCVVPAPTKAVAVATCMTGEVTEQWPASILRTKENATLYLDLDSAKLL